MKLCKYKRTLLLANDKYEVYKLEYPRALDLFMLKKKHKLFCFRFSTVEMVSESLAEVTKIYWLFGITCRN